MKEFLPQLKKLQPISASKGSKTMTGKEIFFMVKRRENDAFIVPVDKKLKPVEADFHYCAASPPSRTTWPSRSPGTRAGPKR